MGYEECAEANRHWQEAQDHERRAKVEMEHWAHPSQRTFTRFAEAAKQAAETSLRAHRNYQCSCVIRAAMEAAKA